MVSWQQYDYLHSVLFSLLLAQVALAAPTDDFVTTWKTDNPGTSNPTSITVPITDGLYDVDWDTSSVRGMSGMFYAAISFDRDIGSWDVTELRDAINMFDGVTLSTANYESLLIGWNAQTLQAGVIFYGGNSNYCSAEAAAARANMIASDLWIITDGGQSCLIFSNSFEDAP